MSPWVQATGMPVGVQFFLQVGHLHVVHLINFVAPSGVNHDVVVRLQRFDVGVRLVGIRRSAKRCLAGLLMPTLSHF